MAKKKPSVEADLNPKQLLFCQYYAQSGDFFGNATLAYAEAYGYELEKLSQYDDGAEEVDEELEDQPHGGALSRRRKSEYAFNSPYQRAYNVCAVEANRLLKNPKVQSRLTILLNALLKDEIVDSQLAKLIIQDADNTAKIAAVREFNKLRGRIIDKTQTINRLPFGETDLSAVIATLPQERQDHFYAVITDLIAEAERVRSAATAESGGTR